MKNENKFLTQSLSLAAAICVASKSKLTEIKFAPNSRRADFIFTHTDQDLQRVVNLFWSKKLLIDASTYFETLRSLKARLYEEKHAG